MGGQPAQQTQTTTQVLSPEQRQLMQLAMPGVTEFAAKVPQRYQGTGIAGFDQAQLQGQEGALGSAGVQTDLARSGAGTTQNWLSPQALDVGNNPAVQGMLDRNARSVNTALTETALPAIRDSAERTGNFGSSRQGVAEGVATGKATSALADANAKTLSDAYSTNVESQLKALGLLPQTSAIQTQGNLTTSGVGDVRQAYEQAKLNEQVGNFNYDQMAPFLQSKEIMSLLSGLPGGGTTSTASTPQKNQLTSALGGAATGASLGSTIMPGIGTAVGGGLGALLGFL